MRTQAGMFADSSLTRDRTTCLREERLIVLGCTSPHSPRIPRHSTKKILAPPSIFHLTLTPNLCDTSDMENTIMDTTVALYARVSTDDKGQNPEVQLEPLRAYAKLRGLTVVAEYVDFLSGSKRSRPELD